MSPCGCGSGRRLDLPTLAVLATVIVAWTLLARHYGAYVLPAPWSIVTGSVEIARTVDDLNMMIMEEVERQQE